MNTPLIVGWLDFLNLSLSLFTPEHRTSVFHPEYKLCTNSFDGHLVFKPSRIFDLYLTMVIDKHLSHSSFAGDYGELDFLFDTLRARNTQGLDKRLWVVSAAVESIKLSPDVERFGFIIIHSKLSRAVEYLREFYDPERPPWNDNSYPAVLVEETQPWNRPGAILDPIPDFGDGIHSRGLGG